MGRSKISDDELPIKELRHLCQLYSDAKVGEMFGVCAEAIRKRRLKHNIKPGKRRGFDPDKELLDRLYQKMSMKEIAQEYGVGETVVWSRLKEHGITLRGYENGGHRKKPGRRFSKEHLRNLRKAAKARRGKYAGENSPNWKGGVSGAAAADRRTGAHREWRRNVLANYGNKCADCGVVDRHICECCGVKVVLHIHHIKPYRDYPELRHDPSNGIPLCPKCHYQRHSR